MIRIQISAMPPLLAQIVRAALTGQNDLLVVHDDGGPVGEGAPPDTRPCDVMLISAAPGQDVILPPAVLSAPQPPSVVLLSTGGEMASELRISPRHHMISTSGDLCEVLRRAASRQVAR